MEQGRPLMDAPVVWPLRGDCTVNRQWRLPVDTQYQSQYQMARGKWLAVSR